MTEVVVHVISRKQLLEAARKHPELSAPLDIWFRIAKRAAWENLADVRRTLPSADAIGKYTVFNVKGNQFRLIAEINYRGRRIYVRHVLTQAEYDRGGWKS
jgi:mRNA interferase HigB